MGNNSFPFFRLCLAFQINFRIFILLKKKVMMNREQFVDKWGMRSFDHDTQDILMIAASFMSDIQETTNDRYVVSKLNTLKEFIFDYRNVLKAEQSPKCNPHPYGGWIVWDTMNI